MYVKIIKVYQRKNFLLSWKVLKYRCLCISSKKHTTNITFKKDYNYHIHSFSRKNFSARVLITECKISSLKLYLQPIVCCQIDRPPLHWHLLKCTSYFLIALLVKLSNQNNEWISRSCKRSVTLFTSPASQKSKDLNKVSLLLQDLDEYTTPSSFS